MPIQERQTKDEVLEARRKFRRVLCTWASDVLVLRRSGLDQPTFAMVGQRVGQRAGHARGQIAGRPGGRLPRVQARALKIEEQG